MMTDFARTLSLLRREKGVSQRAAASELGISQALLSHYENGIREPGLAFVVKACDYYQVSADYLLGRTLAKDGSMIDAQELYDVSEHKDNVLRGSVMAQLNKKLLVNAIAVIYGLLGKLGNRPLIIAVSNYLSDALYLVFRQLYSGNVNNPERFFSLEEASFRSGLVQADLAQEHYTLCMEVNKMRQDKELQSQLFTINEAMLQQEYRSLYQSLLQVLHATDSRITERFLLEAASKKRDPKKKP